MNTASLIVDQIALVAFAALMIWAATSDLRSYTIPNKICLAVVALYPAHVLASTAPVDWLGGLMTAGIVLAIGFVCFLFKWTGAGDVKLIASSSLWAGSDLIAPYLIVVALAGGALSVAMLLRARFASAATAPDVSAGARLAILLQTYVPYGAAIAVGGLYVVLERLVF